MSELLSQSQQTRLSLQQEHEAVLAEGQTFLKDLQSRFPELMSLALLLSMAVRVTPALLRAVRLQLRPHFPVHVEAQLWTSELVQASDRTGFSFCSSTAMALRALAPETPDIAEDLSTAWTLVEHHHAVLTPLHRLEAELQWLELKRRLFPQQAKAFRTRQSELLQAVVSAIVEQPSVPDLSAARWVFYSLPLLEPDIPVAARSRTGRGGHPPSPPEP